MHDIPAVGQLVRYHGSQASLHGYYRLGEPCHYECDDCDQATGRAWTAAYYSTRHGDRACLDVADYLRYQLISPDGATGVRHVNRESFSLAGQPAEGPGRPAASNPLGLETPTSNAEFYASCVEMLWTLAGVLVEVEEWTEQLRHRGLPFSVTSALEALTEALDGAVRTAQNLPSDFTESLQRARDLAARGITITGEDAA